LLVTAWTHVAVPIQDRRNKALVAENRLKHIHAPLLSRVLRLTELRGVLEHYLAGLGDVLVEL
jgi:hypothetical protein